MDVSSDRDVSAYMDVSELQFHIREIFRETYACLLAHGTGHGLSAVCV
jgi:hypothetical protein